MIAGCENEGRVLGNLGGKTGSSIKLFYCHKHSKYGNRVLNYFVNSITNYRLTKHLQEARHDLFIKNEPQFCDCCNAMLGSYITGMVGSLKDLDAEDEDGDD